MFDNLDFSSLAETTELTHSYILECFDYDSNSGELKWKHRPLEHFKNQADYKTWNKTHANRQITQERVSLNSQSYKTYRLAWFIVYWVWPSYIHQIDHNKLNTRISNLYSTDSKYPILTKGCRGVHYEKTKALYVVRVGVDKKYIGKSKDFFEAACILKSSQNKLFREHNETKQIKQRAPSAYESS